MDRIEQNPRVTGVKQVCKAVKSGRARAVYIACDADPRLTEDLLVLCREAGLTPRCDATMQELGRASGIAVGAAAVAVI